MGYILPQEGEGDENPKDEIFTKRSRLELLIDRALLIIVGGAIVASIARAHWGYNPLEFLKKQERKQDYFIKPREFQERPPLYPLPHQKPEPKRMV